MQLTAQERRDYVSVASVRKVVSLLALVAVQDAWWLASDVEHPVSLVGLHASRFGSLPPPSPSPPPPPNPSPPPPPSTSPPPPPPPWQEYLEIPVVKHMMEHSIFLERLEDIKQMRDMNVSALACTRGWWAGERWCATMACPGAPVLGCACCGWGAATRTSILNPPPSSSNTQALQFWYGQKPKTIRELVIDVTAILAIDPQDPQRGAVARFLTAHTTMAQVRVASVPRRGACSAAGLWGVQLECMHHNAAGMLLRASVAFEYSSRPQFSPPLLSHRWPSGPSHI